MIPKWQTKPRLNFLALLFFRYAMLKGWQIDLVSGAIYHEGYERYMDSLIADWKADDISTRNYERKLIARRLHGLSECGSLRGTFNAIARTIYHDSQPLFELEALGINGLTFKPFAKVRIASSYVALHVDVSDTLKELSKSKRRKVIRYGKPMPAKVAEALTETVSKAIRDYLT